MAFVRMVAEKIVRLGTNTGPGNAGVESDGAEGDGWAEGKCVERTNDREAERRRHTAQ